MRRIKLSRSEIRNINENIPVNLIPREQELFRSTQGRKGVQRTMMDIGGENVLEMVSNEKRSFHTLRKGVNGKKPFIIVARTPLERVFAVRYTIWAKDAEVLKKLRDELNEREYENKCLPKKIPWDYRGRGYDWGFDKDQKGSPLIKSPTKSNGTALYPGDIEKAISKVLGNRKKIAIRHLPSLVNELLKELGEKGKSNYS